MPKLEFHRVSGTPCLFLLGKHWGISVGITWELCYATTEGGRHYVVAGVTKISNRNGWGMTLYPLIGRFERF